MLLPTTLRVVNVVRGAAIAASSDVSLPSRAKRSRSRAEFSPATAMSCATDAEASAASVRRRACTMYRWRQSRSCSAAAAAVVPEQLAGMPAGLEPSLQAAQTAGAPGLKNWMKQYGRSVGDPRLAWIELDYVVLVARDDPAEARRLFAAVKKRTTPASPVYERVKQLEKTYE